MIYDVKEEEAKIVDILHRAKIPEAVIDTLALTAERMAFMKYQLCVCELSLSKSPGKTDLLRAYNNLLKVYLSYIEQILKAVPEDLHEEIKSTGDDVLQMVRDMRKARGRKTS